MLNNLKVTLQYLQDKELPCAEVKLAIWLIEEKLNKCNHCRNLAKCAKQQIGGEGKTCEWFPSRFEEK